MYVLHCRTYRHAKWDVLSQVFFDICTIFNTVSSAAPQIPLCPMMLGSNVRRSNQSARSHPPFRHLGHIVLGCFIMFIMLGCFAFQFVLSAFSLPLLAFLILFGLQITQSAFIYPIWFQFGFRLFESDILSILHLNAFTLRADICLLDAAYSSVPIFHWRQNIIPANHLFQFDYC